jgi:hypothetical protein
MLSALFIVPACGNNPVARSTLAVTTGDRLADEHADKDSHDHPAQ